jgi:hypothetical protein
MLFSSVADLSRSGKSAAILDEAGRLGDATIQLHSCRVRFMRQPIGPRAAFARGLSVNVLDQLAADAKSAHSLGDEEILQIAIVASRPARAMSDEVDQVDRASSLQASALDIGSAGLSNRDQVTEDTSSGMRTR